MGMMSGDSVIGIMGGNENDGSGVIGMIGGNRNDGSIR